MKIITFIRHAKSSWENLKLMDIERPLNNRGNRDAPFMGQKLKKHNINVDYIISSPSERTYQTIKMICNEIDYDFNKVIFDRSIYDCNMLDIVKNISEQYQNIVVVGHNPDITYISNLLQKDVFIENVPTCGIISIRFEIDLWKDIEIGGKLNFFDYPKK